MSFVDKLSLRTFIVVTGWSGLLTLIGYLVYKYSDVAVNSFENILGAALTIVSIAISKWLFKDNEE